MSEEHFASVYDYLMKDAPYTNWIQYTKERLPKNSSVVDLACGTGTFLILLQEQGYTVTGMDISQQMLTMADMKLREKNLNIPLMQQDMRNFSGLSNVDGVTLFCDGLNYLLNEKDVQHTFANVNKALKKGGVFLFDVHSVSKMEETFNDELYGENGEEVSYLWFASPGDEPYSVEHSLTFFVKDRDGLKYDRIDELHKQRTFPVEVYVEWLKEAGFDSIEATSDFGKHPVTGEEDRVFFQAIKK